MRRISSITDLEEALRAPLLLIYKHSDSCAISSMALREIAQLEREAPSLPIYLLDVHEQRTLARALARTLDVRHESPQAILVRDGAVAWHGSHFAVTASAVLAEVGPDGE